VPVPAFSGGSNVAVYASRFTFHAIESQQFHRDVVSEVLNVVHVVGVIDVLHLVGVSHAIDVLYILDIVTVDTADRVGGS
jgi:hypothetical protein